MRASALSPDAAFVELQAYRQGQNDLTGAQLIAYDQTGITQTPFTFTGAAPNAQSQRTMLAGRHGRGRRRLHLRRPRGGAVAVRRRGLPARGDPARLRLLGHVRGVVDAAVPGRRRPRGRDRRGAVPDPDDRPRLRPRPRRRGRLDSSAADFAPGAPTPRPNSVVPAERDCVPCGGSDATIIGTDGKETIRGTKGPDVIAAQAGADKVKGLGGKDVLCGGIGKDVLIGGAGRDKLIGARGRDTCKGGKGRDSLKSCEAGS